MINEGSCSPLCQLTNNCGNNQLEFPEECDDGNNVSGDQCSANCLIERCGDGVIIAPEECEPPNIGDCDPLCHFIVSKQKTDPHCQGCNLNQYISSFTPINKAFETITRQINSVIFPEIKSKNHFNIENGITTINDWITKLPSLYAASQNELALLTCLKKYSATILENKCPGTSVCNSCDELKRFLKVLDEENLQFNTTISHLLKILIQITEFPKVKNSEIVSNLQNLITNLAEIMRTRHNILKSIQSEADNCQNQIANFNC
jgi:cysteine-rich repeat protein